MNSVARSFKQISKPLSESSSLLPHPFLVLRLILRFAQSPLRYPLPIEAGQRLLLLFSLFVCEASEIPKMCCCDHDTSTIIYRPHARGATLNVRSRASRDDAFNNMREMQGSETNLIGVPYEANSAKENIDPSGHIYEGLYQTGVVLRDGKVGPRGRGGKVALGGEIEGKQGIEEEEGG